MESIKSDSNMGPSFLCWLFSHCALYLSRCDLSGQRSVEMWIYRPATGISQDGEVLKQIRNFQNGNGFFPFHPFQSRPSKSCLASGPVYIIFLAAASCSIARSVRPSASCSAKPFYILYSHFLFIVAAYWKFSLLPFTLGRFADQLQQWEFYLANLFYGGKREKHNGNKQGLNQKGQSGNKTTRICRDFYQRSM